MPWITLQSVQEGHMPWTYQVSTDVFNSSWYIVAVQYLYILFLFVAYLANA